MIRQGPCDGLEKPWTSRLPITSLFWCSLSYFLVAYYSPGNRDLPDRAFTAANRRSHESILWYWHSRAIIFGAPCEPFYPSSRLLLQLQ